VAIGTANRALGDLRLDAIPRETPIHQLADRLELQTRIFMVEVEHPDIGFATVDARMVKQVCAKTLLIVLPDPPGARPDLRDVLSLVLDVPVPRALSTPGLQPVGSGAADIEIRHVTNELTCAAALLKVSHATIEQSTTDISEWAARDSNSERTG
jgi:hypothetical protein